MYPELRNILTTIVYLFTFSLCVQAQKFSQSPDIYNSIVANCDSARHDTNAESMYRHAHKAVMLANSIKPRSAMEIDSVAFYKSEALYYIGKYYKKIGQNTSNTNYFKLAKNYFNDVIRLRKTLSSVPDLTEVFNSLASTYYLNNQPDSAVIIYKNNIDLCQKNGNMRSLAKAYHNLGCLYHQTEQTQLAEANLLSALRIRQMIGDRTNIASTYVELSDVYATLGDLDKANSYILKALQTSTDKHTYVTYANILHASYLDSRKRMETTQALSYLEKEMSVRDSIAKHNSHNMVAEKETRYQIQITESRIEAIEKQNEIDTLRQMQKAENDNNYHVVATILLLIVVSGFAIYFFRQNSNNKKLVSNLQSQNKIIQRQSEELSHQRDKLSEVYESTHDSIRYASKIQLKVMNGANDIKDIFPLSFVFYKPKEIVSGDFYFVKQIGEYKIAAVADCTGHGMPAALLSILCFNFLSEELVSTPMRHANEILESLRSRIKDTLYTKNSNDTVLDGCDMGIVIYKEGSAQIEYSGANIDLYITRQRRNEHSAERDIEVLRATHNPLGWFLKEQPFKLYTANLNTGDEIYMLTDGYKDQMSKDGTFGVIRIKKLLSRIANLTINEQRREVQSTFSAWMDTFEQVDDVTLLGIKFQPKKQKEESQEA